MERESITLGYLATRALQDIFLDPGFVMFWYGFVRVTKNPPPTRHHRHRHRHGYHHHHQAATTLQGTFSCIDSTSTAGLNRHKSKHSKTTIAIPGGS